jgi:hypothetical protein
MCGGCGYDIDVPHDSEIKPWMYENTENVITYNESHLGREFEALEVTECLIIFGFYNCIRAQV